MSQTGQLWAVWPLASGWMLLWGLAAAIPILIHLWYRRQARNEPWAAMEFLLAAIQRYSRRLRFEQWLLLAIRVLILLLLALTLADPWLPWESTVGGVARDGSTHLLIVIDGSYSMDLRRGGRTLFDRARDAASQLVRQSRQGDGFSLVVLADPPQAVVAEPTFDRSAFLEELQTTRITHGGADLRATLAELGAIVERAERRHSRLTRHRICLISDLGKNTWAAAVTGDGLRQCTKLAERATLELIDVGQVAGNAALVDLTLRDSLTTIGRDLVVDAEIQDFGSPEAATRRVEFLLDGRLVGQQTVDVPPGGRVTTGVVCRCDTPGDHLISAVLHDDALPLDNQRWLSVAVREQISALCIEGRSGESQHVALALEPHRSETPRVRVEQAGENAILERPLSQYDLVCLSNIGRFTSDEAGVLREFLSGGGGLIVFPGDQTQVENYNAELGSEVQGLRILPVRLESPTPVGNYRFDPRNYADPLVAVFRGQERAGLLSTPVWKYVPLEPYDDDAVRIALWFEDGRPAIVRQQVGRGECIVFATAASPNSQDRSTAPPTPWTALPTWPSFVPLIQECLRATLGNQLATRNVRVGQPWELTIPNAPAGLEVTVTGPSVDAGAPPVSQRVSPTGGDGPPRWLFTDTQHSGRYTARWNSESEATRHLAVNLDTRESDLARVDPETLPDVFRRAAADDEQEPSRSRPPQRQSLFRPLLGLLLGLLVSESLLAWWFGRSRG